MQIGIFQTARMEQRLLQSPQMIQAMQILQLSTLDLQERIEQERLENPLLERKSGLTEMAEGDDARARAGEGQRAALDAVLAMRERDRWDPALRRRKGTAEESDRKHEAMQNTPAAHHSLGESLLSQLALIELDEHQREMLEFLVFSLDARERAPAGPCRPPWQYRWHGREADGHMMADSCCQEETPRRGSIELAPVS